MSHFFSRDLYPFLFLFCLGGTLYFGSLGVRDLWHPDEPRFAQVSVEMNNRGDYIFPHVNDQPYPNKPPLYFWMVCLFSWLAGGVSEFVARIPSALAATMGLLVIYSLGRDLFHSRQVGFFSALIAATTARYFWQARFVQMDMLFSILVLTAFWGFVRGMRKDSSPWYLFGYAMLGLAVLTKGPLGVILLFLALVPYLFWRAGWRKVGESFTSWLLRIFRPYLQRVHIGGFFLLGTLSLSWILLFFFTADWVFIYEHFIRQQVGRYTGSFDSHIQPFYYYFTHFPADFLPWTIFAPGLACFLYSYIKDKDSEYRQEVMWLLLWFGFSLLFFSFSRSKQSKYLLPLLPAVALLMGFFFEEMRQKTTRLATWGIAIPGIVGGGLLLVAALAAPLVSRIWFPSFQGPAMVAGAITGVGGGILLWSMYQKNWSAGVWALSLSFWLGALPTLPMVMPLLNQYKSARPMAREMVPYLEREAPWCQFGIFRSTFIYYTGKFCRRFSPTDRRKGLAQKRYIERFREFLKENPQAYVLTVDYAYHKIPEKYRKDMRLLLRHQVGSKDWQFYRYRKGSSKREDPSREKEKKRN